MTEKAKFINIRVSDDLMTRAKAKAGMVPLSRIIRRLLEMWLDDEIDITRTDQSI